MGWQGASWHHPAQTHTRMQMRAHMCSIYHLPHTHALLNSHTHACAHIPTVISSCSHSCLHTYKRVLLLMKFLERKRAKGEGGVKVCRERNPNVSLSVCLLWALSTCFIHSALSAGILGPRCKHWVYKCFALLFVCPQSQRKPQGEKENGEERVAKDSVFPQKKMMRMRHQCKILRMKWNNCCGKQFSKLV